jgi:hypothetical protein
MQLTEIEKEVHANRRCYDSRILERPAATDGLVEPPVVKRLCAAI